MSRQLAEGVAIGIPFSLNWTNVAAAEDVDAKTVSSSTDQALHRRTIAMSNASFVMELATNSICSFSSDLLTDGTLCFDSNTPYHAVFATPDVLISRGSTHRVRTTSMDYARETYSGSVYRDPPYDAGSPVSESAHRRMHSFRKWNHSIARSPSRLFDVLECDALEEGVDDKLMTSRTSSKRSWRGNAGWSSRRRIGIRDISGSVVFGAGGHISPSITSTATSKSMMQSQDLWQCDDMKDIRPCGLTTRLGNWRSSWTKVLRCCCVQPPHVKH